MINRRRRKRTSPPSSRTKTSPCSKGDMVPASMFKYGSAWKRLKDESYYKSVYGKKKKKKREEKLRERENRFWWKWREGHRLWARRLCCWRWRLCRGHWPLRRWWPRISLCDLGKGNEWRPSVWVYIRAGRKVVGAALSKSNLKNLTKASQPLRFWTCSCCFLLSNLLLLRIADMMLLENHFRGWTWIRRERPWRTLRSVGLGGHRVWVLL